jgi:hypothetical protein
MFGDRRGGVAARCVAVVGLVVFCSATAATASHADGLLPDPVTTAVASVTQPVSGPVTTVTSAVKTVVAPLQPSQTSPVPGPNASETARPAPADTGPRGAAAPSQRPAGSRTSSAPPARPQPARTSAAAAPAGAEVASADATVAGLVGACVRITRQVVPLETTLVVLDHDLIAQLEAAGVPLQQLVVPCPASSGTGATGSAGSASSGGGTVTGDSTSALSTMAGRLAFTGATVIPAVVVAVLMLCLGVACVRRSGGLRVGVVRG